MISGNPALALNHQDAALLGELMAVWQKTQPRNLMRTIYFEGKNAFKDFGIAIPPNIAAKIGACIGWNEKGVRAMVDRSVFEGFVSVDGGSDPHDVSGILADNNFGVEFPQAQVSTAVHAASFLTVSRGDTAAGEADVMVMARAADNSAALWDRRRRALKAFLSIVDVDAFGNPTQLVMHTPFKVITMTRVAAGWQVDSRENPLREVSVAVVPFKPELNRPFGHSRITRPSMYFVDAGIRTIMRGEVSAEIYSAPEYWLFGADPAPFTGSNKWKAMMGRIKAIGRDDDGEIPEIHRFNAASPQPIVDHLRMFATLFAGDQGLSVSSLGITQENPSSAEAIYAAKEDLIIETRGFNRTTGAGAVKAAQLAIRLRDGLDVLPDELRRLSATFTDPAMTSPTAQADAFVKRAGSIEGFADTEVGLEMAGLSREQVKRFLAEKRQVQARGTLDALVAAGRQAQEVSGGGTDAGQAAIGQ